MPVDTEKIKLHIEQFRTAPDMKLVAALQTDLNRLIGRYEYDDLKCSIDELIRPYKESRNFLYTEQQPLKNVLKEIKRNRTYSNMWRHPFVIIHLYRECTVYNEGMSFKEFHRSGGHDAYLKTFDVKTGQFTVTMNKSEAGCFFKPETIDAFHAVLSRQKKEIEKGTEHTSKGDIPYKKVTGGWQISEVMTYKKNGDCTGHVWMYPDKRGNDFTIFDIKICG